MATAAMGSARAGRGKDCPGLGRAKTFLEKARHEEQIGACLSTRWGIMGKGDICKTRGPRELAGVGLPSGDRG